jgi:hypothetical protein
MKRVVIHIDRLVLSGVSPAAASQIAERLRQSLLHGLRVSAVTPAAAQRRVERLDAGTIRVSASTAAERIGTRLAGTIARHVKT